MLGTFQILFIFSFILDLDLEATYEKETPYTNQTAAYLALCLQPPSKTAALLTCCMWDRKLSQVGAKIT